MKIDLSYQEKNWRFDSPCCDKEESEFITRYPTCYLQNNSELTSSVEVGDEIIITMKVKVSRKEETIEGDGKECSNVTLELHELTLPSPPIESRAPEGFLTKILKA